MELKIADFQKAPSPSFVVSEELLLKNLQVLKDIQDRSGAKILLALKGFSMFHFAPLIQKYLAGVCASGLWEAQLGSDYFQGEVHTYSPAFKKVNFDKAALLSSHICVNSLSQWDSLSRECKADVSLGIRVNPEITQSSIPIYDPCIKGSRFGVRFEQFNQAWQEDQSRFEKLEGLHFHALCQHNAEHLKKVLEVMEENWSEILHHVKWINFGGGHHLTHPDYNRDLLVEIIQEFSAKYNVQVIMEPGEAIVYRTGFLVSEVVDVIENHGQVAILDVSCTCHMPDVLEMPYRPGIIDGGEIGEKEHQFRLGGNSCLSGDVIGEWTFDHALKVGDRVIFKDMAQYTMVKSTTFNGVIHPDLCSLRSDGSIEIVKHYEYEDFRNKLG